jgi:gamma-glutamyltranspeptidase/glutathione hydrolase
MRTEFGFESRRSPVLARNGIVATSQPLAAQAGLEILRAGGNAADAAVAAAVALNVVEPTSTGIGGDCFCLFYNAQDRRVYAVNGSGRAPAALTIEMLNAAGCNGEMPRRGAHAVTVPGTAAGWQDTVARHGRLSLATVLAPAIRIAEEGHPVAPLISRAWQSSADLLGSASPNGAEMLINGRGPRAGEIRKNPNLANVLRAVADGGGEAFYQGWAGQAIVDVLQSLGGVMTVADLAEHRSTFEPPISTTYRDYTVHECAPNGQGLTALIALNILEGYELQGLDPRSSPHAHLLIEALRLAFADARWFVADPAQSLVPVEGLLSKDYAKERRALIDPLQARTRPTRGEPVNSSDTVYVSAADGEGNACSFINSNYQGVGTGIVPPGCGFTLQNRGAGFVLDPGHPNALAPRKRPYHTIIPAMSTHADGALHASFGVMGGYNQPQGHVQVFANLVDHNMDPQLALDTPRFSIYDDPPNGGVYIEDGYPTTTMSELGALGHEVVPVSELRRTEFLGKGQIIVRDRESGVLWGGSDPRADGAAVGF